MNVTEKFMCQQMALLAAGMNLPQAGEGKDSGGASFQDMIEKASEELETKSESPERPADKKEPVQKDKAPAQSEDQEELKAENVIANPGAAPFVELFRPEITPAVEETAAVPVLAEAPVEMTAEPEAAVDLPVMDEAAEIVPVAEAPEGDQAGFQQMLEEAPTQEAQTPVERRVEAAEPERTAETGEVREELPEVEVETVRVQEDADEPKAEAAEIEEPLFHDAKAAPVKVGETYEPLDTQEPDMDEKLADTIRQAVQAGSERVEIRLTPQNLGALTIEMTKDANGALQVVLHASNSRTAGLLDQHLNGLHAALQNYSQEPVQIEVQRGEESQQQHFQQQADPDGRGRQRQQRQETQEETSHGDFLQKLRLGLFGEGDIL